MLTQRRTLQVRISNKRISKVGQMLIKMLNPLILHVFIICILIQYAVSWYLFWISVFSDMALSDTSVHSHVNVIQIHNAMMNVWQQLLNDTMTTNVHCSVWLIFGFTFWNELKQKIWFVWFVLSNFN